MKPTPNYRNQLKAYAARRKRIIGLHRRKLSLSEIGAALDPPISRQRVHQILRREGIV